MSCSKALRTALSSNEGSAAFIDVLRDEGQSSMENSTQDQVYLYLQDIESKKSSRDTQYGSRWMRIVASSPSSKFGGVSGNFRETTLLGILFGCGLLQHREREQAQRQLVFRQTRRRACSQATIPNVRHIHA